MKTKIVIRPGDEIKIAGACVLTCTDGARVQQASLLTVQVEVLVEGQGATIHASSGVHVEVIEHEPPTEDEPATEHKS